MSIDPSNLRADARRNYERLVQAAEATFSAQGALATLEHIAKRAGVGIGTLYRHFPTRQSLLEAVYADIIGDLIFKASRLLRSTTPDKALIIWLQSAVEYSAKYTGFNHFLATTIEDRDSEIVAAGAQLLAEAQKKGLLRKDITILDLMRLMNGIVTAGASAAELKRIDSLVSIIMKGFAAEPRHPKN